MPQLIQEMIHENNHAPAEGLAEKKIAEFETRYDAIVQKAGKEYDCEPPSDYYRDGYNLYLRMVEYKHNHLLFLSNPLVDPDKNLCERKARVLKGKINQAISLRSFNHLTHFCESLSVLDSFAVDNKNNLFRSTKETTEVVVSFVLALPIFPARLQASIFGASELNFRVRDGNGWTLAAINTNSLS